MSTSIVFSCRLGSVRRLLTSTLREAHYALIIFAGSVDATSGAWILADGVFEPSDLGAIVGNAAAPSSAPSVEEAEAAVSRRIHFHLPFKGSFSSAASKSSSSSLAAFTFTDATDEFEPLQMEFDYTSNVMEVVEREIREPHEDSLLSMPGTIGALTKKELTVYVFPAENSDCFLISVRGFTMLVNGGHAMRYVLSENVYNASHLLYGHF